MSHFRYTIAELSKPGHEDYLSDEALLIALINERQSSCTNINSPLYERLAALKTAIEKQHNATNQAK